jgi:hypothetical protein
MTLAETADIGRAEAFRYGQFDLDARTRTLTCSYDVGGHRFEERVVIEQGSSEEAGVEAAAGLVFLLAGISYFKAFAPRVIDLGSHPVSSTVRSFLRDYYVDGLGEFAYRNNLDLRDLEIVGGLDVHQSASHPDEASPVARPLIPFGGGMDSLVSVELARPVTPDASLFVVSGVADRFEAIERAASATGLPVLRATRALDPSILRSRDLGFLNGHVPVTGILSAIAVLAAVMSEHDAVVMSNEWSASVGNVEHLGQVINHQHSKSLAFERLFRGALRNDSAAMPNYFSLLRPFSELWIAQEFSRHPEHLLAFRSCNRAFHIDPSQRLDRWCGQCDKCVFIDLILSPFVDRHVLSTVFAGAEPLENPELIDSFRTLLGADAAMKPFECVGDVDECRAALVLAAARPDRNRSALIQELRDELDRGAPVTSQAVERFLAPIGEHFIPEPYASELRLE